MLIHPCDRGSRQESLAFLREHDFGELIAMGRGRDVPVVVPTQFVMRDDETVLLHLAHRNPVFSAIEENPTVLLSVHAAYSYIPGAWRAIGDEDPALGIPTIYYAAVQLRCTAELVDAPAEKLELLRHQLRAREPGRKTDPAAHARLLPGIRGARLTVREMTGKFKFGGNVDVPHRLAAADRLAERQRPADIEARDHLLRRLHDGGPPDS